MRVQRMGVNPQRRDQVQNSVCVLYPIPTVWSSHPIIVLNEREERLIEAMEDCTATIVAFLRGVAAPRAFSQAQDWGSAARSRSHRRISL
jgi:hypothetical protein